MRLEQLSKQCKLKFIFTRLMREPVIVVEVIWNYINTGARHSDQTTD